MCVEQLLESPIAPRLQLGGDALVDARRDLVEPRRRHRLDACQLRELVETWVVPQPCGLVDPDDATGAGGLEDRVAAEDHLSHTDGSDGCRLHGAGKGAA